MENIVLDTSIVSVAWLNEHRNAPNLVILDASLKKVTTTSEKPFAQVQIPNARFFDIKNDFSNTSGVFPNTCPTQLQFNASAKFLGINSNSAIVVYDDKGIYSSPRAWWLFKAFGHDNIAVLDGGLPAWLKANYEVEHKVKFSGESGNFKGHFVSNAMKFFEDIEIELKNPQSLIVDARSEDRFKGLIPEPRVGLRSGHIQNAVNLPFGSLLDDGHLKSNVNLRETYQKLNPSNKPMLFSCGSGITACILALAADTIGCENLSVYDGSWTEYGSLTNS